MTDIAAGWKSDPSGRHDHRYWDGTGWTEHVSDAGVASTDPLQGDAAPPPTPPAEEPTSEFKMTEAGTEPPAVEEPTSEFKMTEAGTEPPAVEEPTSEFRMTEAGTEPPAAPEPLPVTSSWAGSPTADDDDAADVTAPDPAASTPEPEAPAPAAPSYGTPLPSISAQPTASSGTPSDDEPTLVGSSTGTDETTDEESTEVIPVASGVVDPTSSWPTAPSSANGPPPPTFTPPAPTADGDGGGDRSKRRLLLGIGALVIVAVVVALLSLGGGGGDGDLQTRISKQIREGGQSGLSKKEADCLAGELIDKVGKDKLKDVDFSADEPPKAVADELNDAFVKAIPTCHIDLSDDSTPDDSTATTAEDGTASTLSSDQISEFRKLLAQQYRDNLGLSDKKADCLANTMADAIERGELDENQSFDAFFQYLTACDISVSELGGAGAATTG